MEQRTQEERARIVARCVEIEKAGGDVLAYLSSEHYISPGATWRNMQKFDLRRTTFSDGKPVTREVLKQIQFAKEIQEKTAAPKKKRHPFRKDKPKAKPAAENKKQTKQEKTTMAATLKYQNKELAELVVRKIADGFTPVKAVAECGYKNPNEKLKALKEWALEVGDNDLYTILNGEQEPAGTEPGAPNGPEAQENAKNPEQAGAPDPWGDALTRIHEDNLERKAQAEEAENGEGTDTVVYAVGAGEAAQAENPAEESELDSHAENEAADEVRTRKNIPADEQTAETDENREKGHGGEHRALRVTALEGEMAEYRKMADGRILISGEAIHHDGWLMTPEEMETAALEFFEALRMMGD